MNLKKEVIVQKRFGQTESNEKKQTLEEEKKKLTHRSGINIQANQISKLY